MANIKQLTRMRTEIEKSRARAYKKSFPLLSLAETKVLTRILIGESAAEAGEALKLSPFTVSNHTRKIFEKFGTDSRTKLMAMFVDLPVDALDQSRFVESQVA